MDIYQFWLTSNQVKRSGLKLFVTWMIGQITFLINKTFFVSIHKLKDEFCLSAISEISILKISHIIKLFSMCPHFEIVTKIKFESIFKERKLI